MKHIAALFSTVAAVVLIAVGCATNSAPFTPEPGFTSLFNGTDLTGWGYTPTRTNFVSFDGVDSAPDGRYTAKAGVLIVHDQSTNRGPRFRQLYTKQQFPKNFVLKLEFRAAVNADSGIYIRQPQLQCRDYLVAGPYKQLKQYKPQDWNEIIVEVKDNVAHATCNGEVLEAALKLPATGPIGLEADHGKMEYRRIRIMELP